MSKKSHNRFFKRPGFTSLTLIFTVIVFLILTITVMIISCIVFVLNRFNILNIATSPNLMLPLMFFAILSIIIGTGISLFINKIPKNPIIKVIDGLNHLANGDFDTRLEHRPYELGAELANSFNSLATELQNTEMLRSDFINNFSHEFKTPIVSISGFAKLLQHDDLTEIQRKEYANIIYKESTRLADLATNILDLTKLENQSILIDITTFNVSEQIRTVVLLLEKKWSQKKLAISLDFAEHNWQANEEQLMQVWINLLDNAIKFADVSGAIDIIITEKNEVLHVSIKNSGSEIDAETQKRIFNKFYQADTSHAAQGTGIGLAIVQKIVTLHKGTINVSSRNHETTFTVILPKKMKE